MTHATRCGDAPTTTGPCPRCDVLIGLEGLVHVETVQRDEAVMTVTVSTPWQLMGCPERGVLDAFHVVKLGTQVVDEVRRRVQQATLRHRGRKGDPLQGIATILRAGAENLTDKCEPALLPSAGGPRRSAPRRVRSR